MASDTIDLRSTEVDNRSNCSLHYGTCAVLSCSMAADDNSESNLWLISRYDNNLTCIYIQSCSCYM